MAKGASLRQYIGTGKTAVNFEKISKRKNHNGQLYYNVHIWVGTYAMLFLLLLCDRLSETVASGSLLTASTLLSFPRFFCLLVFKTLAVAENLDKQPKLYPELPCEINEKQNCVKILKIIRKNIFMGINHIVF